MISPSGLYRVHGRLRFEAEQPSSRTVLAVRDQRPSLQVVRAFQTGEGGALLQPVAAVSNCRTVGKAEMVHNQATPRIEVDPETYEVRADGELLTCEPADVLPMAQRYFLF